MPIVPIRGMGAIGIVSDLPPQDLPLNAWRDGINVRFLNGAAKRYSTFKKVSNSYTYAKTPVGVLEGGEIESPGLLITVFNDGTAQQLDGSTITDVTPAGTLGLSNSQITSCTLGGVRYYNRSSDAPVYRSSPLDGAFTTLPGWDLTYKTRSLRSYKDFLIALNVSKGAVEYEGMVKWSNAAQFGAPPADWDVTLPSSLSGETILNDITAPLVDGLALGRVFMIYGEKQVYRMTFIDNEFLFAFDEVFPDRGVIAENCVVDVKGLHYVFGEDDIYVHDGVQPVSIVEGKVAERIFSEIDFSRKAQCFVYHDPYYKEVVFCYPSKDDRASWSLGTTNGCNRAFVFNYKDRTTSFIDLPGVVAAESFSQDATATWEDLTTWDNSSGNWSSYQTRTPNVPLLASVGNGITPAQPYLMDPLSWGRLPNAPEPSVQWTARLTLEYLDLDELQLGIYGTKLLRSIHPQVITGDENSEIMIQLGWTNNLNVPPVYEDMRAFNPAVNGKHDGRVTGRYLAMKIEIPPGVHAELSGFDADINKMADR